MAELGCDEVADDARELDVLECAEGRPCDRARLQRLDELGRVDLEAPDVWERDEQVRDVGSGRPPRLLVGEFGVELLTFLVRNIFTQSSRPERTVGVAVLSGAAPIAPGARTIVNSRTRGPVAAPQIGRAHV